MVRAYSKGSRQRLQGKLYGDGRLLGVIDCRVNPSSAITVETLGKIH